MNPQARWRSLPPEGGVRLRPGKAGCAAGSGVHAAAAQRLWVCLLGLAATAAWGQADVLRFSGHVVAAELRCPSERAPTSPLTGYAAGLPGLPAANHRVAERVTVSGADGPDAGSDLRDEAALPAPQARSFRMAVWGDSHTAAGSFVDAVADAYGFGRQRRQPSFLPPTFGVRGVRLPVQKACVGGGWQLRTAQRAPTPSAGFGKALVALSADSPDSALSIDFRPPGANTRLRALDVHYSRDHIDRTLVLGVSVDGGPERVFIPRAAPGQPLRLLAAPALATVRLRLIAGQINLEGFAPVYDTAPAAVVDVFSVPGATTNGWRAVDARRFKAQTPLPYDLVLFQYGTNDAMGVSFDATGYTRELRQNLAAFVQANPRARCVLIGPPDRGAVATPSAARTGPPTRAPNITPARRAPPPNPAGLRLALVHQQIGEIQQRVGREQGCAFWNWQAAMGGAGSAARWLTREPALMQADLVHLSTKGYALSGQMFGRAFPLRPR